jgi:hypothetical protein
LLSDAVEEFDNVATRLTVMGISFAYTEHICKYSVEDAIRWLFPQMTDGQLTPIIALAVEYLQVYSGHHQH